MKLIKKIGITNEQLLKIKNKINVKEPIVINLSGNHIIIENEFLKLLKKIADEHDETLERLKDL